MKRIRLLLFFLLTAALILTAAGCSKGKEPALDPMTLEQTTQAVTSTEAPTTEEETTKETQTEEPSTEEPTEASTEAPTEEPAETQAPETVASQTGNDTLTVGAKWYVNADSLNIRSGASTDYEAVGVLYRGEQVLIMAISGEWVQIKSATADGYVKSSFLVSTYAATGLSGEAPKDPEEEAPAATTAAQAAAPSVSGNGHIVCLDAGHQQAGISEQEPNGPGSSVMKAKLTTGTQGCVTGLTEHALNLTIALGLKQELINRGYQVVMIRETEDCPLSNAERAQVANGSGAEIFVRIHANSSNDSTVSGAQFYAPSPANPYMSADLINASNTLSAVMLDSFCAATGAINRGLLQDDGMTGINWCTIPVTIAEMGFMSNPNEDQLMADSSYQAKMITGLANGIDAYFGR